VTPGPALPRLLASLALGCVLAAVYWLALDAVPAAMLAEAAR
jgi:hypothetical protein